MELLTDRYTDVVFSKQSNMNKKTLRHNQVVMLQVPLLKITNEVVADTVGGVACVGFHKSAYCEYQIDCSLFVCVQKQSQNINLHQRYSF